MITIRKPEDIYLASGVIDDGTFLGRWHFSFGEHYDAENMGFGTLRVFNDDTLSPGAVWPLHPHRQNADVLASFLERRHSLTYEFPNGRGGYLYVVEGGPISLSGASIPEFGAAKITGEDRITITSEVDAELLLVDVALS